ncbi:MAG: methyltransferase domain-containing protein [Rhodobacteraceae bacterium]|nr:methyltransferase domain-containing protein [Paracoccaceae bacterium]
MATTEKTGILARRGAVALLHAVVMEHRLFSDAVEDPDGALAKLAPADRARAQSLAALVLRNVTRLDGVLDGFLKKPPPLKARNALRVCAAEILLDDIPPHAAVNAAVQILRASQKTAHLSGMVNAVGRRLAEEGAGLLVKQAHPKLPKSIRGAVLKSFGEETTQAIEAAHTQRPPVDLTLRTPGNADRWAQVLGAEVLPTGSLRLKRPGQISALPGYDEGAWWVQDAAAALAARLLGDVSGQRVLDLCAAPGGKTLQLAAAGAEVVALDISAGRMARVEENLARTKLKAEIVIADALKWGPDQPFDAILLDAPCSATGTIRRHPDLPLVRPDMDLKPLMRLQQDLLRQAFGWLKPGGRLVFSTCSLIPAEGERQVAEFMTETEHAELGEVAPATLGCEPAWQGEAGSLRLRPDYWPERGGMDGFFMALMQRRG